MSAKKVAVFVPSLTGGGAERTNTAMANEFAKRGLSVDLVVVNGDGPFRKLIADNVRLVVLGSRRCMTSVPHFCRYLRREHPDAVMATMRAGIVALLAARIVKGPWRTLIRYEGSYTGDYLINDTVGRLLIRLHARLLPSADAAVAVCEDAAADIVRASPRASAKMTAIPNPIFEPRILELADQPVAHRWLRDPGPELPVVVSVGRLDLQKDYATLLKAFAEVVAVRPARLVIVGEGPERPRLTAIAKELNITEFFDLPGFQHNPFAYVRRARVFALSSICEGSPAVLIEAMACGTPVVSTACPTGPREVLEDGKWGALVPVGDSKAMARAILRTLDQPVDSEALVARAKYYSVGPSVDQHLRLMFPDGWEPGSNAVPAPSV